MGPIGKAPQSDAACLIRQQERGYPRQIIFGRLFTWPADQPRRAAYASGYPVEPNSPPRSALRSASRYTLHNAIRAPIFARGRFRHSGSRRPFLRLSGGGRSSSSFQAENFIFALSFPSGINTPHPYDLHVTNHHASSSLVAWCTRGAPAGRKGMSFNAEAPALGGALLKVAVPWAAEGNPRTTA